MRRLVAVGVLERLGAGAIRIADVAPPANAEANIRAKTPSIAVAQPVEVKFAEPKRKPPRPYFARINPNKDMKKQVASRIVQYIAAHGDESGRVAYMAMYHSLHGRRYCDRDGHDLWAEASKYLSRAVRRERGMIWLDRETRMVSQLPPPYKRASELRLRKRKPKTAWFNDVASRAEANGLTINEQIVADREGRTDSE